jgi:hypothetical protein
MYNKSETNKIWQITYMNRAAFWGDTIYSQFQTAVWLWNNFCLFVWLCRDKILLHPSPNTCLHLFCSHNPLILAADVCDIHSPNSRREARWQVTEEILLLVLPSRKDVLCQNLHACHYSYLKQQDSVEYLPAPPLPNSCPMAMGCWKVCTGSVFISKIFST